MAFWTVDALYYGKITIPSEMLLPGLEPGHMLDIPYLGFLLKSRERVVLVDNGINEKFIVNGRAWANLPAEAGGEYVLKSLKAKGVSPEQVELVLYTHLHNDHAGNCHLFPYARHVYQKDEWRNLLDPIPSQKLRKDYDPDVIPVLRSLNTVSIDGDLEITPGIRLYKTPGHTLGSQVVAVDTDRGTMVILGDMCNTYSNAFPETEEITDLNGKTYKISTNPGLYGPGIPSVLIYDHFDWYDSMYKVKALAQWKKELILPGHEPDLLKKF